MSLFIENVFSLYNPIKFLAILYPTSLANLVVEVRTRHSHQIIWKMIKENDLGRLTQLRTYVHFPLIQVSVSVVIMLTAPTHSTKRVSVTIQINGQRYSFDSIPGHNMVPNTTQANVSITPP